MTYKELNELLTGRCHKRRLLARLTWAERTDGGSIVVRFHDTPILDFRPNGRTVVSSGGWKTCTTKDRLNRFMPDGHRIYQRRSRWWWSDDQPFADGDVILPDGSLRLRLTKRGSDKEARLFNQLSRYAALYEKQLPLPMPSGADCLFCCMVDKDGKTLGDGGDHSHLLEHIRESYVVPSLAYHAMNESGFSALLIASAFGQGLGVDCVRRRLSRAVRRYVGRRLGLVN